MTTSYYGELDYPDPLSLKEQKGKKNKDIRLAMLGAMVLSRSHTFARRVIEQAHRFTAVNDAVDRRSTLTAKKAAINAPNYGYSLEGTSARKRCRMRRDWDRIFLVWEFPPAPRGQLTRFA